MDCSRFAPHPLTWSHMQYIGFNTKTWVDAVCDCQWVGGWARLDINKWKLVSSSTLLKPHVFEHYTNPTCLRAPFFLQKRKETAVLSSVHSSQAVQRILLSAPAGACGGVGSPESFSAWHRACSTVGNHHVSWVNELIYIYIYIHISINGNVSYVKLPDDVYIYMYIYAYICFLESILSI